MMRLLPSFFQNNRLFLYVNIDLDVLDNFFLNSLPENSLHLYINIISKWASTEKATQEGKDQIGYLIS